MNQLRAIVLIVAAAFLGPACQKVASTSNTSNTNSNAVVANSNAATPAANTPPADDKGNAAGSPTDVYKAAYAARKNKDLPALKKIMSKDILSFLTDMGKDDKKSLDDVLTELCERPQAATAEARNEKIDGDHASIEYVDEDKKWKVMDFVREDGVWKMSTPKGPGGPNDDKEKK